MRKTTTLFNKELLNNKDIYLIYTKVHHDECTYPEIFHTLKNIKSYLLQNYTNITEIAISDLKIIHLSKIHI